jgi:hypothetical protein
VVKYLQGEPRMTKPSNELKIEYRKVSELTEWDKNPRSINNDAFERLKTQIVKLGMYKPLIVDQLDTILGGNMRFKAIAGRGNAAKSLIEEQENIKSLDKPDWYIANLKKMDLSSIPVVVQNCETDADRVEIALSDNDRAGYYNETELSELVALNDVDGELFSIDLTESKTIDEIINAEPSDLSDDKEVDAEKLLNSDNTHTCPACGFEFTAKEEKAAQNELE